MSNIAINDLEMNKDIDQLAAAGISGGFIVGIILRKVSYKAGKFAGKKLDKKYGLSDKASDAAIKTLGPAPKWLQSWF